MQVGIMDSPLIALLEKLLFQLSHPSYVVVLFCLFQLMCLVWVEGYVRLQL